MGHVDDNGHPAHIDIERDIGMVPDTLNCGDTLTLIESEHTGRLLPALYLWSMSLPRPPTLSRSLRYLRYGWCARRSSMIHSVEDDSPLLYKRETIVMGKT